MLLSLESDTSGGNGTMVMIFEGDYDLTSKALLRRALDAATPAPSVVLDFSTVSYIDSTVLCELLLFSRARLSAGREPATLVIRDGNMQRLIQIASVAPMFAVVESLDEAIPHGGKPAAVRYVSSFEGVVEAG